MTSQILGIVCLLLVFIFTFSNRSWLSNMLGEEVKDRYKELIDETPTWVGCLETLALEVDILARIHVCRVRLVVRSQRTIHPLRPSKTWCLVFSMRNFQTLYWIKWGIIQLFFQKDKTSSTYCTQNNKIINKQTKMDNTNSEKILRIRLILISWLMGKNQSSLIKDSLVYVSTFCFRLQKTKNLTQQCKDHGWENGS